MKDYVVLLTADVVQYASTGPSSESSLPESSLASLPERSLLSTTRPCFRTFVEDIIFRSAVTMSTLLVSLVYLNRAKYHLLVNSEDWTLEQVFLGALIIAAKVREAFFAF